MSWVPPRDAGSAQVRSYIVLALRGNEPYWTFGDLSTATTLTLNYLSDRVTYRFEVAAENASDLIGPYSSASPPVTPSPMVEVMSSLTLHTAPDLSASLCTVRLRVSSDQCFDLQQNSFVEAESGGNGTSPITAPPFWIQNIVVIEKIAQGRWVAQPEAFVLLGSHPELPVSCSGFPSTPGVCKRAAKLVELKQNSFPTTVVVRSVVSRDTIRFYDSLLGSSPFFTWSEPSNGSGTSRTSSPTTMIGGSPVPTCAFSGNGCPVSYRFEPFDVVWDPANALYQGAPEAVLVGWDEGDPTASFLAGTSGSLGSHLRLSDGRFVTQTVCTLPSSKAETGETGDSLQWALSPGGVARFSYMAGSVTEGVAFL
ncbi:MAG: fibronectin type III domain-containing protein, partial [Acidimicrobiales bacterium]